MVEVNGVTLNVNEAGSKNASKLIIFLHGFPETGLLNWKYQIVHFAKLGYKVLAYDQRGYNSSSKGNISMMNSEMAVEDVKAIIEYYNYPKAYIVAHDWGGVVGWSFVIKYPHLVEKYVAINMVHPKVFSQYLGTKEQFFKSWYVFFFQLEGIAEWKVFKDDFNWFIYFGFGSSNPGSYSLDDLERYKQAWRKEGAMSSMLHWYRHVIRKMFGHSEVKDISRDVPVKVPTLILWGKQDPYLCFEMAAVSIGKEYCQNGSLMVFDDATHWLPNEKPKEVNLAIENFFKE